MLGKKNEKIDITPTPINQSCISCSSIFFLGLYLRISSDYFFETNITISKPYSTFLTF